ncbi:MAG: stage 0 sporulation family protein, partial [Clostridia bacterium]|nr:stage 0 sporulation family protein [Clostridia bacterium]
MFDYDPEPIPEKEEEKTVEVVGIRFRNGGKVYYFAPGEIEFIKGEHAIVETVRGVEYGEVALGNKMVGESEVVFPLKPVMRKATKEDDERNIENRKLEENAKPIWYEKVAKNGLEMQLIDVEYTHDNAKLCFYFTADGRVDFRELVKDLASVFRTRIELRQIGVRDEAKLFGGLGSCGRPFCCNTFLPDFAQVSIKMAKDQNLSLSSSKISGACGRLMCCLRFEHDTYEREYATFPKVDTIVDTPKGRGVIIESSFLTGKIKVKMNNDQ